MKYRLLRQRITDMGYTAGTLSEYIGKGPSYVSQCMCGHIAWRHDVMCEIMRLLDIPARDMGIYFPPGGMYIDPAENIPKKITADKLLKIMAGVINEAICESAVTV